MENLTPHFYRHILNKKMSDYPSLRAFAKGLQIDPSSLVKVLSAKQSLSLAIAKRAVTVIDLSPKEKECFLSSVLEEHKQRKLLKNGLKPAEPRPPEKEIDAEVFDQISNLYHYGIMELTFTEGFNPDHGEIAKQLGITDAEAEAAIQRLVNAGLLEKNPEGGLKKTHGRINTADKNRTTLSLRKHQRQVRQAALIALDKDPIETRCMASSTLAIDPDKIGIARTMIDDFIRSLSNTLATGKRTEVHQVSVSLYSLEKSAKELWKNREQK